MQVVSSTKIVKEIIINNKKIKVILESERKKEIYEYSGFYEIYTELKMTVEYNGRKVTVHYIPIILPRKGLTFKSEHTLWNSRGARRKQFSRMSRYLGLTKQELAAAFGCASLFHRI